MNEELRQKVVKQFEKLNLQYDRELQETVSFAAKLCQTPVSLITLLDKDTQWVKLKKGLNIDRIPRELSFCTNVIKRKSLFIINDTHQETRFSNHPFVIGDPKVRFYAGAPLITHDGHCVGTLCVMDYKPRALTSQQKLVFKILAKHTISVMELKLSFEQLDNSLANLKQIRDHKAGDEIKLRSMFESLTDAYFLFGKAGEIKDFNRAAYDFVKDTYAVRLTYGRTMTDFLTHSYQETFSVNYRKALSGTGAHLERFADYGSKGTVWWDCVFTPVRNDNGEIVGVSYVARNINDRKLIEENIIEKNRLLLKVAEIQSHDYRGPVATILGLMGLIKADDYVASKEYLIMLETAVKKLDEKIHEVVNIVNDPIVSKEKARLL
jgi:PAS domain S-box-containing protein